MGVCWESGSVDDVILSTAVVKVAPLSMIMGYTLLRVENILKHAKQDYCTVDR